MKGYRYTIYVYIPIVLFKAASFRFVRYHNVVLVQVFQKFPLFLFFTAQIVHWLYVVIRSIIFLFLLLFHCIIVFLVLFTFLISTPRTHFGLFLGFSLSLRQCLLL